MAFKTVRRGYDKRQVDEYIFLDKQKNDEVIEKLRKKTEELRSENASLVKSLEQAKVMDKKISEAIILALDFKDKIIRELNAIKQTEEERLIAFKQRWQSYLLTNSAVSDREKQVAGQAEEFLSELNTAIAASLDIPTYGYYKQADAEYESEVRRLNELDKQNKEEALLDRLGIIEDE